MTIIQGRLREDGTKDFSQWDAPATLREITFGEARYSRGFLRLDVAQWVQSLGEHWLPLFHGAQLHVTLQSCETGLDFPEDLDFITGWEMFGERQLLGAKTEFLNSLADSILPGSGDLARNLLLEYLLRRLLSTVNACWHGTTPLNAAFVPHEEAQSTEVVGSICACLIVNDEPYEFWLGLSPGAVEQLDSEWRRALVEDFAAHDSDGSNGHAHQVTVELCELAVPPMMVIDYVRSGSVIDLEMPISDVVLVRVDGDPWAKGRLVQFNGRFAVEISRRVNESDEHGQDMTNVQLQIAQVELDRAGVIEHDQAGAVLLTKTIVTPNVSLIISGENVATAVVGEIHGQFALNVLPKSSE